MVGAWARVIRNLVTQGLCSSFSLLPSATSLFYVAKYESLIDCWHFLFIARLLRQAGIYCVSVLYSVKNTAECCGSSMGQATPAEEISFSF